VSEQLSRFGITPEVLTDGKQRVESDPVGQAVLGTPTPALHQGSHSEQGEDVTANRNRKSERAHHQGKLKPEGLEHHLEGGEYKDGQQKTSRQQQQFQPEDRSHHL
jgi:hypothetical protein